jgi:predicted GIY-YIG superfamily endonuclease
MVLVQDGHFIFFYYPYILCCADGSCCVGTTVSGLDLRIAEHHAGMSGGYTSSRRP